MTQRFDAAYYRRYYGRRPVHTRQRIALLAEGVFSLAAWWRVPIRSVLEVGAGKGFWRDWLQSRHPRVSYHGIDASEYACRRYQHELADLATWKPPRSYDLVVCQSVLQYLDDSSGTKAIDTLADACRGLLFFDVPTIADRDNVIDAVEHRPRRPLANRRLVPQTIVSRLHRDRRRHLAVEEVDRRLLGTRAIPASRELPQPSPLSNLSNG